MKASKPPWKLPSKSPFKGLKLPILELEALQYMDRIGYRVTVTITPPPHCLPSGPAGVSPHSARAYDVLGVPIGPAGVSLTPLEHTMNGGVP